jgi:hypothetical protein
VVLILSLVQLLLQVAVAGVVTAVHQALLVALAAVLFILVLAVQELLDKALLVVMAVAVQDFQQVAVVVQVLWVKYA